MSIASTLTNFARKYSLSEIESNIQSIQQSPLPLNIGILGDFNSGKSTLINAMLNKKILPAMEKPTTGSIIQVLPKKQIPSPFFYKKSLDGSLQTITPIEFSEIATGKRAGQLVLEVPSLGMLQEGYSIIDTPGLHSLNQDHTDITFGYLPFLDGVVICQDINKGGLTESLLNFLKKPEMAAMHDSLLFVLTRADQKPAEACEKVRQALIKELSHHFPSMIPTIAKQVIYLSAQSALQSGDMHHLQSLQEAFQLCFIERKNLLWEQRQEKMFASLRDDLVFLLNKYRQSIDLSNPEVDKKRQQVEEDIRVIKREQEEEAARLRSLKKNVFGSLHSIAEQYAPRYEHISKEEVEALSLEFSADVECTLKNQLQRHLDDFALPPLTHIGSSLQSMVTSVETVKDVSAMVITAAITATTSAGTGLLLNAAEAGAAGAAQVASRKITEQTGDLLSAQTVENTAKGVFRGALAAVGNLFHRVNPVNHVANFVSQKVKSNQAQKLLDEIVQNISNQIYNQLTEHFEQEIFLPLLQNARELNQLLESIQEEKESSEDEKRTLRREIEQDIKELSKL